MTNDQMTTPRNERAAERALRSASVLVSIFVNIPQIPAVF
jgi:hypothetical protein